MGRGAQAPSRVALISIEHDGVAAEIRGRTAPRQGSGTRTQETHRVTDAATDMFVGAAPPEPRGIVLRDYQAEALEKLRDGMRQGLRRQMLCLGTGGGKTIIAAALMEAAAAKGQTGGIRCRPYHPSRSDFRPPSRGWAGARGVARPESMGPRHAHTRLVQPDYGACFPTP